MVAEEIEEYALASSEAAYEDLGEHALMGFIAAGRGFHDGNASHWWDKTKLISQPDFIIEH